MVLASCNGPIETILSNNEKYFGKMIDSETRFDTAYTEGGLNFYYCYSIKNKTNWSEDKTAEFQKKLMEKILSENLKPRVNLENAEFKVLHDNDYNIYFLYRDFVSGSKLASIKFNKSIEGYQLEKSASEWDESVDLFYNKLIMPNK